MFRGLLERKEEGHFRKMKSGKAVGMRNDLTSLGNGKVSPFPPPLFLLTLRLASSKLS